VGENRIYAETEPPADRQTLDTYVRDLRAGRAGRNDPRAYDPRIWRGIYREMKR
jgi:hypothetical protein